MSDLVGNPKDRFSHNKAQFCQLKIVIVYSCKKCYILHRRVNYPKALFFLILGLRIFFQNIKVGGGEKIKIKITKKIFFI